MMAFILATDFDFIAYMSKMAFLWKLFSRQWHFWNMISMIFVVLYDICITVTCHTNAAKQKAQDSKTT